MPGLPSELYHLCRTALLKCSEFDTNASLHAVFVTDELYPFRSGLPEAASKNERVDACLDFLLSRLLSDGQPVLPLFLAALRDRYQEGNALRDELDALVAAVQSALVPPDISPTTEHPSQPTTAANAGISSSPESTEQHRHKRAVAPRHTKQSQLDVAKELTASQQDRYTGQYLVVLASAVLGFLTGVLGNLMAAWIQQDILRNTFTPGGVTSIVVLTGVGLGIGVLLQRRTEPVQLKKASYWVFVALVTGTLILAVVLAWQRAALRPPTVYFVIDATKKMEFLFDDVRTQVQVTAAAMPPRARVGLRIYGGRLSGVTGCRDTIQLLEPNTYEDLGTRLDSILSAVEPSGYGSLTVAVLDTIYDDLAEREGPGRLFIITSGPDPQCDPQESGILESRAGDIGPDIDVLIVSIGELGLRDRDVLESYATAFGGHHYNIRTAADLPPVIESVSSYGSNYFLENLTPQPTP